MRTSIILSLFAFTLAMGILSAQTVEDDKPSLASQLGLYLNVDAPFKSVMPEMSTTGLFGVSFAQSPYFGSPFMIELKGTWGNYGLQTFTDHNYEISGWGYPADVHYKSGYQKYLLGPKFMLGGDFRVIRGFATPQIGLVRMRSKTSVTYYDGTNGGNNGNGSHDLFQTPLKNTGWVFGAEAGMEISIQRLIKPDTDDNTFRLLISGSLLRGFKEYKYGDVDTLIDPTDLPDDAAALSNYIQISHPQVWQKKYVEIWKSALQMWGVNVGLTINI